MSTMLINDYTSNPALFHWNGAVKKKWLLNWLAKRDLSLPADLIDIWLLTGGGDMFETEILLSPVANPLFGDNIEKVNSFYHEKGVAEALWVVHTGFCLTAIRLSDKKYIVVDRETFWPVREYCSLDEWYCDVLRAEYAERYGLK